LEFGVKIKNLQGAGCWWVGGWLACSAMDEKDKQVGGGEMKVYNTTYCAVALRSWLCLASRWQCKYSIDERSTLQTFLP
jgi:hypothetical protein